MNWRRLNHILHRDIGFFCIGLTLIYAVSGIAVNHISHSFNPSYIIENSHGRITPLAKRIKPDQSYIDSLLVQLNIDEPFKNGAMLSPGSIRVFTETYTVDVEFHTGMAKIEQVKKIPVLYEFNFLHLNKAKGLWTWIADIYGIALIILSVTGILMIRGRTKLRGTLLTIAGIVLPAAYLVFIL